MSGTPPVRPAHPEEWATSVVLADGEIGYVRAMAPEDAPALLAFHERQPRENLYRRFFSPKPTLRDDELRHFTEVDYIDRVALVLELRGEFIAWASYERWPGRPDADVAFMVDDDQQGRGIATLLLEHLAAIARTNGIGRFTADVLADNRPMLGVFAKAGWPVRRHFDSGVMELEFSLDDSEQFLESVEQREQRADSRSMARLLFPRSVAVIGASDTPRSIGHELWRNVVHGSLPAFPVNPNHATVGGEPAYASVLDIVDDVWLAIIASPAGTLAEVIDQCIAKRVRGAVVITAVDGTGIDMPALVAHARRNGMRIIGPASMGLASSPYDGLAPVQAALVPVDLPSGRVALSLQSGSLGASLLQLASQMSMGFSWFVSLGDKSDVSGNDLLQFWEDDDRTAVIAMYTETFGNPRKFARLARRVGRRKPIVAVRTGAAAIGAGADALYQQAGLIEVPTVRAMLDTARVLECQPIPSGPRVAVLTNSRSPGVLAEDAVRAAGLDVVDPPLPLDWRSTIDDFGPAIRAAIESPDVDAILVIHAPPIISADHPADSIDAAAAGSAKPVLAVMLGRADGPVSVSSRVPSFSFPEPAAAALGRMYRYRRWLDTEATATLDELADVDPALAAAVITEVIERGEIGPLDVARVLGAYGIGVAPTRFVRGSTDEVVAAARATGYPIALKAEHRRPGRSAEAGVALDVRDDDSVRDALDVMRRHLGTDADAVYVQRMATPGVDLRVRCITDPRLGPVVSVGLGGISADAIGDAPARLAPLSHAAADNLVRSSRAGAALQQAGIDTESVVDLLVRTSRLAYDHPDISELDINPAIASHHGCQPIDVTLTLADDTPPDSPVRRLM